MSMSLRLLPVLALVVSGCADAPDLGLAQPTQVARDYPALIPLDTLLAQAPTNQSQITPASISTTNDRIANLRARANRLRGPVVDAATKSRMRAAVARAALR